MLSGYKNVDELESAEGSINGMSKFLSKEDIISEIEEVGGGESAEHVLDVENDWMLLKIMMKDMMCDVEVKIKLKKLPDCIL